MAVITPNTDVILLKVPLEINDNNQLTFANATAQYNYFNGLTGKRTFANFTYQRKDNTITLPALVDDLYGYNYVMYRNTNYSNKWFYAFVTNIEYVNDSATKITIKTDVWQTYMFQLTYKATLIDREHPNTDVAGDNTLPEGLELGEMVANGATTNFGGATTYCTVIEVAMVKNSGEGGQLSYAWDDDSATRTVTPIINDIPRGTIPLIVGIDNTNPSLSSIVELYDSVGLGEAIVNVYLMPQTLVGTYHNLSLYATSSGGTVSAVYHISVPDAKTGVFSVGTTSTFTKPTTVNGYTPKNKKLLTYPYCYFNVSNNAGTSVSYHYEDFSTSVSFDVEGTFGASGNTKALPKYYKNLGTTNNVLDYSINGAKYPICSWRSDSYTNWLTQNGINLQIDEGMSVARGLISGIGTGAGLITAAGLAGAPLTGGTSAMVVGATLAATANPIINTAIEQYKTKRAASFIPDQVKGNMSAGDFVWAKYQSPFTYIPMSIKAEYARCIDEFFSTYGYKCNRIKIPNVTGRTNWNYVKTVGCYIQADIPQEDLEEIKALFDKGITFWHNPTTFMDYSQSNAIVTP